MPLEIERKDGYFNISGLAYDDEQAMRIADFIVNVLQDEHMTQEQANAEMLTNDEKWGSHL
tara:strand:+ start:676 stop:858 length:183 start_codon:yes stop_codon:yes gene_type:complete